MSTLRVVLACPCGARFEFESDRLDVDIADLRSREEAWQIRHDGHVPPATPTGASSAVLERFGRSHWSDDLRMGPGFNVPLARAT